MSKKMKEAILITIVLLPLIYLALIWKSLPDIVPTHFNVEGDPNDWSNKTTLIYITSGVTIGIYLLMLIIPFIDPKKKIEQMGNKYYNLRFILTLFMSILAIYIIFVSKIGTMKGSNGLFIIIGAFFAALGNYFQTVRANYFVGIRTPWTLENENVWKKTHRLGGQIWMIGGVLLIIFAFTIRNNNIYALIFAGILAVMIIVPIIYSYKAFQKEKTRIDDKIS